MSTLKKGIYVISIALCTFIIGIMVWIWTADNIQYTVENKIDGSIDSVYLFYQNPEYWPEWQKGIKSSRILEGQIGDKGTTYEVVRKDDDMEFKDTITVVNKVTPNSIVLSEQNLFYKVNKDISFESTSDSMTLISIDYKYNSSGQLERFMLSFIESDLLLKSENELRALNDVYLRRTSTD